MDAKTLERIKEAIEAYGGACILRGRGEATKQYTDDKKADVFALISHLEAREGWRPIERTPDLEARMLELGIHCEQCVEYALQAINEAAPKGKE